MAITRSALEKLLEDVSRYPELRESVQGALDAQNPADFWVPFKKALDPTYSIRIRESALAGLAKLFAHDVLTGSDEIEQDLTESFAALLFPKSFSLESVFYENDIPTFYIKKFTLIDQIIVTVLNAFQTYSSGEESVQLQGMKFFLTVITNAKVAVHERTLVCVLQACFAIYAVSVKNNSNHVTAKAALTQMINLQFLKMESTVKDLDRRLKGFSLSSNDSVKVAPDEFNNKDLPKDSANNLNSAPNSESEQVAETPNSPVESDKAELANAHAIQPIETEKKDFLQVSEAENMLLFLIKKNALYVLKFLSIMSIYSDPEVGGNSTFNPSVTSFFKSTNSPIELSLVATRTRALALEMLMSVFHNAGPVLLSDELYVKIVKESICLSISKNSITMNPVLFELSLSIFLLLIRHYRSYLKLEIEVLLSSIYIQILEMGNSTFEQRNLVLQALYILCETPQILMDIYCNYDCDLSMVSLFEKIMTVTTRIGQGRSAASKSSGTILGFNTETKSDLAKSHDKQLRFKSLCVLEAIMSSLVDWSTEHKDKNNGSPSSLYDPDIFSPVIVSNKNPINYISLNQAGPITSAPAVENEPTETLEKMVTQKQMFSKAIQIFNSKPGKGLKLLVEKGFITSDPDAIVKFLKNTTQLSKHAIGDFLGDVHPENIRIMHLFVDQMDFMGFDFVAALRHFLQSFRLPGEAQKIDRLMEKFADRYCECNPQVFAQADTAYSLAFSVIMLNTDLHSDQIKHKMDKAAFIKNNRGINDQQDLPEEYLSAIYDQISLNEIIMEDEGKLAKTLIGWGADYQNERARQEMYNQEVATMQKKSEILMATATKKFLPFKTAGNKDIARSMFVLSSWAIMAAISLQFENALPEDEVFISKERNIIDLCISGFVGGIKISCLYKLETEKDAFVASLSKMTSLTNFLNIREKNIKAIKALLKITSNLGDELDKSWIHILKSISMLERLQVALSNDETASTVLKNFVQDRQSQANIIRIDRIFTSSVNLSASSIVHFFKAVCLISLDEVGMDSNGNIYDVHHFTRMYHLQKIVEISYYNMHRIRFEWTQLWRVIQPHFNMVACHPNLEVATFAVDSLRQLGMKILEREELEHFSSQHEFLKSFEYIIKHSKSFAIKELILNSMSQMIISRARSIRSGWKSIFGVLLKAAQTDEKMATYSFGILKGIFNQHFGHLLAANVFVDLVACLAQFALLKGSTPLHDEQVMSSIQLLQSCIKTLYQKAEQEKNGVVDKDNVMRTNSSNQPYLLENGHISEEHFYLSWFPILNSFSRVISDSDGVLVRTHTMETLFETFKTMGHLFEHDYWKAIHRNVISPIFDEIYAMDPNDEANAAVLILGLRLLVDLISMHFDMMLGDEDDSSMDLLLRSLDRMVEMMGSSNEKLASTGQICFHHFLMNNINKFKALKSSDWLVEKIESGFKATLPIDLINCDSYDIHFEDEVLKEVILVAKDVSKKMGKKIHLEDLNFGQAVVQCRTHLDFVQTIREFGLSINSDGFSIITTFGSKRANILDCITWSYSIARAFNTNLGLRHQIFKHGWVNQLPNLLRQETISIETLLALLFSIMKHDPNEQIVDLIVKISQDVLSRFIEFQNEPAKYQRDLASWNPAVVFIFKELVLADWGHLKGAIPIFYKHALKIIMAERTSPVEFLEKVGKLVFDKNETV